MKDQAQPLRVAIAGGGTGGHVTPALAIAAALEAAGVGAPLFVGTAHGLEARLVPARGYRLHTLPGSRLVGGGLIAKIKGLWGLMLGIFAARRVLLQERIEVVIGVGGYASGAALLAARTLGLPTAIHESNAVPGLTNRVLGRLVGRVWIGMAAAAASFAVAKTTLVGNPVRPEIASLRTPRSLPIPGSRPLAVLIVGGSQGARFLNDEVPSLLAAVCAAGVPLRVRHQVGKLEAAPVRAAYAAAGIEADVVAYIDDMAGALSAADLAITRAGSGTLAELAAAGLPALLVPFPFAAGDHQAANAAAFCAAGAGTWSNQAAWQVQKLAPWIVSLLTDPAAYQRASQAARAAGHPDAATVLVADCLRWLGRRP